MTRTVDEAIQVVLLAEFVEADRVATAYYRAGKMSEYRLARMAATTLAHVISMIHRGGWRRHINDEPTRG